MHLSCIRNPWAIVSLRAGSLHLFLCAGLFVGLLPGAADLNLADVSRRRICITHVVIGSVQRVGAGEYHLAGRHGIGRLDGVTAQIINKESNKFFAGSVVTESASKLSWSRVHSGLFLRALHNVPKTV